MIQRPAAKAVPAGNPALEAELSMNGIGRSTNATGLQGHTYSHEYI
jgi:hypothetical protein